jgi:hypothetical protein
MSETGRYCKAFYVRELRAFADWPSTLAGPAVSAPEGAAENGSPSEDDYLFVHDDFTVTKGIFPEQDVVLRQATPEWEAFCTDVLKFEVPR